MTAAERLALAGALLLVLLHLSEWQSALEYDRALLGAQPWRLLTAHVVHLNWPHALVNALAWWVLARLFAQELRPGRQLLVIAASTAAIGASLALLHPSIALYRGFSGVLHGLYFAGALAWLLPLAARRATRSPRALWLPLLLAAGGALKVLLEQPPGSQTPYAAWLGAPVVPQAHLAGALAGAALGAGFGWRAAGGRSRR